MARFRGGSTSDETLHEADEGTSVRIVLAKSGYSYDAPVTEVLRDGGLVYIQPTTDEEMVAEDPLWLSHNRAWARIG